MLAIYVTDFGPQRSVRARKPAATGKSGGPAGNRLMLLVDPVGALSALGLEGFDGVPGFLHRPRHEAADAVLLMPMSA